MPQGQTPRKGETKYDSCWVGFIKEAILSYMEEQSVNTPPTSKELVSILGIKRSTLDHWKENYVEVRHALETGLTQQQIEIKRQYTIEHSGDLNPISKYIRSYHRDPTNSLAPNSIRFIADIIR